MGLLIGAAVLAALLALMLPACRWGASRVEAWVPERALDMALMSGGAAVVITALTALSAFRDPGDRGAMLLLLPLLAPLMSAFMIVALYVNLAIVDGMFGRAHYDRVEREGRAMAELFFGSLAEEFLRRLRSGWVPFQSLFTPISVLRERSSRHEDSPTERAV